MLAIDRLECIAVILALGARDVGRRSLDAGGNNNPGHLPRDSFPMIIEKSTGILGTQLTHDRDQTFRRDFGRFDFEPGLLEGSRQSGIDRARVESDADRFGAVTFQFDRCRMDQLVKGCFGGTIAIPPAQSIIADTADPRRQAHK